MIQRRRRIYCAVGGVLLLKHWLTGEYGALDRVMEMIVIVLIMSEIVVDALRRRTETLHKNFVNAQVIALGRRLAQGERLHAAVPNPTYKNDSVIERENDAWIQRVRVWVDETNSALAAHSPKASAEFMTVANAGSVSLLVGIAPHGFYARGASEGPFKNLSLHLENLRRIISAPEAYF